MKATVRTASTFPERVSAAPNPPSTAPQANFWPTEGFKEPPLVNMPNTNAALTTLVTRKMKESARAVPLSRFDKGSRSNNENRAVLTSSRTSFTIPP